MSAHVSLPFAPTLVEKLFALRAVQPFDRLVPSELVLLSEVVEPRVYAPGEIIHAGTEPLTRLVVIVDGRIVDDTGSPLGPILGVPSLLLNQLAPPATADPATGARVLVIAKSHFFTLARECPEFLLGLLELGDQGARSAPP